MLNIIIQYSTYSIYIMCITFPPPSIAADSSGGKFIKNTTKCDSDNKTLSHTIIGYVCALIAVLGFGSNFIPVKKFDTGDGMFFQWVLCIGIWLVGLVVNLFRYQPPFFYPVFFGGILWTSGDWMEGGRREIEREGRVGERVRERGTEGGKRMRNKGKAKEREGEREGGRGRERFLSHSHY